MICVGFIVEGPSDKIVIDSERFRDWVQNHCSLRIADPIIDAGGNGNMCSRKISTFVEKLRIAANPDKIIVLADLDPDRCAPCITERKTIIGSAGIDLVVIARKAMESWFLADTEAMRKWTGDNEFYEPKPEDTANMPWDRLKQITNKSGQGPGASKKIFAKIMINHFNFDIQKAAQHPACPSARYFVARIGALGRNHRQTPA